MRNRFLLGCLLFSGCTGLAYELLWVRLLTLGFGSTSLSFSTVLAVFFGGLALGAYLAGRRAERLSRPVLVYAAIELLIGVLGILLYWPLKHLDLFFARFDPGVGLAGALARLLVATPLLLLPTLLMGATLPVAIRAMIDKDEDVGRGTAIIYGVNTLGAFAGAYLITFWGLPELGVLRALLATAGLNVLVASVAWLLGRAALPLAQPQSGAQGEAAALSEEGRRAGLIGGVITLLGGFAAIGLQVVWVRQFSILLSGTIYGTGSVLIAVLVGIGLGSLLVSRWLGGTTRLPLVLATLQLVTIAQIVLLTRGMVWVGYQLTEIPALIEPGRGRIHLELLLVVAILLLPTLCSGASFPVLVRLVESRAARASGAVGRLYAFNTVGSILGSLVVGFFILPASGSIATTFLGLVLLAVVAILAGGLLTTGSQRRAGLLLAGAATLGVALYDSPPIEHLARRPGLGGYLRHRAELERAGKNTAFVAEGQAATVLVVRSDHNVSLSLNGLGQGARNNVLPEHMLESLLVGVVPLVHTTTTPERALLVGLGAGGTVDVLKRVGTRHLDLLEIEPRVVEGLTQIYPEPGFLAPPQVDLHIQDARHFLLLGLAKRRPKYQLIASMPAHPWVAPNIFTREFFELARENLTADGVFGTWFGVDRMDRPTQESLLRAFTRAFPNYVVYAIPETRALYLVGSPSPLRFTPARVEQLLHMDAVADHQGVDLYFLPTRVTASGSAQARPMDPGLENTDDSAVVETRAPLVRTSSTIPPRLFAQPYLDPDMLPGDARGPFLVELLEHLLGTPGGLLPHEPQTAQVDQAERTLAGAASALSAREVEYFRARIQHQRGDPGGREALASITRGGDVWAASAAKMLAGSLTGTAAAQALAALPATPDVLAAQLQVDRARALARVPRTPPADGGAVAQLLYLAVREGAAGSAERDALIAVGPELARSANLALLGLCAEVASRLELPSQALQCRQRELAGKQRAARQARTRGARAGAVGRFAEAARALAQAAELGPGDPITLDLWIRALIELGREADLAAPRAQLRFAGLTERQVESLVGRARDAARRGERINAEPGDTSPAPMDEPPAQ